MATTDACRSLPGLLADAGLPADPGREPLRVWAHSAVERLRFTGQASVVLKYASTPFDHEHQALRIAEQHAIPVPHVLAARTSPGWLVMLMDDLGDPIRDATDGDGARAAVTVHRVIASPQPWMPVVDSDILTAMPRRIAVNLRSLALPEPAAIATALAALAPHRAEGAGLPPFGLCHSEFHPTSLHIGGQGWHLLDFARAFIGPGLLDLASWPGTIGPPDIPRTRALIESYITHGGHRLALARRGGLDAAAWALAWHRIWVAHWFTEQIGLGWAKGAEDTWTTAITRHLTEAAALLSA
jgi:hypothetical protein